jgi:hypothetical protein
MDLIAAFIRFAGILIRLRPILCLLAVLAAIAFGYGVASGVDSNSYPLAALTSLIWLIFLLAFAELMANRTLQERPVDKGYWANIRWGARAALAGLMVMAIVLIGGLLGVFSMRALSVFGG